jgi:uncharacterized protein (TIGR03437 family)
MTLHQTRYRLRAGESTKIDAPRETLDFLVHAKTRRVEIAGKEVHGIVVGPSVKGDQVLLAASLTMKPGEYAVIISAVSRVGEARAAVVNVSIDPMQPVPSSSTVPPVVLLNGLQLPSTLAEFLTFDTCPVSMPSETFGSLETQLETSQSLSAGNAEYPGINGAGVPVVYFFDNCVEAPNDLIENLGNVLGDVLDLIQYENGALVPQVDLVSHSMGGLIVRAYLSGLQTNGALSPPLNPRVRKFIEIATPNFGSFLAANYSYAIPNGTQTAEMIPGSTFLWYLATWNQRGDDLRGVDGLAIVGNAGYWQSNSSAASPNLSDGVVSITSASLGFVPLTYARSPSGTIVLPYCHTQSAFIDCSGGGIANVDQAPETGAIILSFLQNTSDWKSIGSPNQTEYGGIYFALENAAGTQYTALESVSLGSQSFQGGANDVFYYNEFSIGTGTLEATSTSGQGTNCGSFSVPGGYYSPVRCKYGPLIYSVLSSLSTGLPGLTVASGSTITISGVGFSSSTGTALLANGALLSGQIVSDQEITAFLPSNYVGLVSLAVSNGAGEDAINIVVAPPALPPTISLSPAQLQFSYTVGGAAPVAQSVSITNVGGGTLTASATTTAAWLALSASAPSTLAVSILPAGLGAGTYTGSIQISAAGASNSPVWIPVTLTVAATVAVPPFMVALSTAGQIEPFAPQSIVSAYGANLANGTSLSAATIAVTDSAGVARVATLFYASPTQLNFEIPAGTAVGSATVSIQNQNGTTQTATIQIGSVSPGLFALSGSGLVAALVLPVTSGVQQPLQPVYQFASGNVVPLPINLGPSAEQVYLEMYGTGIRNANSVTATVGDLGVPVLFAGAAPGFAGEDQVNIGPLPRALAGQGNVSIVVTADGHTANTVNVTIQ